MCHFTRWYGVLDCYKLQNYGFATKLKTGIRLPLVDLGFFWWFFGGFKIGRGRAGLKTDENRASFEKFLVVF